MKSFIAGIGSIAILMGFLVGASYSPIAGVAVTAAFGVIAATISFFQSGIAGVARRAMTKESGVPDKTPFSQPASGIGAGT